MALIVHAIATWMEREREKKRGGGGGRGDEAGREIRRA